MNPTIVLSVIGIYFLILILISQLTSKNANTSTFFTADKQSPWYLVAFGMIGASLSGVTFISVPGWVADSKFSYMQMVLGNLVGYAVIGLVLMPMYYRLNLVSIYTYLEQRFGFWSYKTGAFFFLLSRTIGASFRLFLVAGVLQIALFDAWNIPFAVTVAITILLIWLYTFRGGIKTIVWTDTLQTLFILAAVAISIWLIKDRLDLSTGALINTIEQSEYSQMFFWDLKDGKNFFKQFLAGAFISIVMMGLDQDMMQKHLTCRNLKDAQKNIFWFSVVFAFVNLLFLGLGAMLYIYAEQSGIAIPANSDDLYPVLALNNFSTFAGIIFLLGIIAAAYSSADSALTALTTSFCVDFLNFDHKDGKAPRSETSKKKIRQKVHIGFSLLIFLIILVFKAVNDQSVISAIFKVAGYTYGPLLGLYAFGLFFKGKVVDKYTPYVCVAAPVISVILDANSAAWFSGFSFGFFILIVNGFLTLLGLWLISSFSNNAKV
ncbi:sodium:solute symporter [Fulvivirgaceae bacterium BMA12]|uniref:Sodium:solute symporter n=1 Tax=Agaribacillus aureus TaxID=3051825 RepID=A0ABT8L9I2_9BACT|nr:sodium:solute symporter [Fulvivirgaceae bacterium BMA12]